MAIERTLVQIRERSLLDLLDLSLIVIRRRPIPLALAMALGIAPFAAFNAWLSSQVGENVSFDLLFLWLLEAPFATAPLTLVLGGLMFGQPPRFAKLVPTMARSALPLIVVHTLFRVVFFFWIFTRLAFANQVVLLERKKWWTILGRGRELSSGRGGELFLIDLFQFGMTYLFVLAFFIGSTRAGEVMLGEELTWEFPDVSDLGGWQVQLPIWLVVAFFAVVRFFLYIDQRIRLEGWEVELRLREVGEAMEASRRW